MCTQCQLEIPIGNEEVFQWLRSFPVPSGTGGKVGKLVLEELIEYWRKQDGGGANDLQRLICILQSFQTIIMPLRNIKFEKSDNEQILQFLRAYPVLSDKLTGVTGRLVKLIKDNLIESWSLMGETFGVARAFFDLEELGSVLQGFQMSFGHLYQIRMEMQANQRRQEVMRENPKREDEIVRKFGDPRSNEQLLQNALRIQRLNEREDNYYAERQSLRPIRKFARSIFAGLLLLPDRE